MVLKINSLTFKKNLKNSHDLKHETHFKSDKWHKVLTSFSYNFLNVKITFLEVFFFVVVKNFKSYFSQCFSYVFHQCQENVSKMTKFQTFYMLLVFLKQPHLEGLWQKGEIMWAIYANPIICPLGFFLFRLT